MNLIVIGEVKFRSNECHLQVIMDVAICIEKTLIYNISTTHVVIYLFLILVLTRGASYLGLVPTRSNRSASCTHKGTLKRYISECMFDQLSHSW